MSRDKNKQLMINLFASIIVFAVQLFINFGLSPYVIGKLGEAAYGFITLANNFTQYASLITVAINSMASRFISIEYNRGNLDEAKKYFSSVFWFNVFLSLIVLIVSLFIVGNIESLINVDPDLVMDVKITFFISFVNLIVSFISTVYISSTFVVNRMDLHAYIQIGSNLLRMIITIILFSAFFPHIYFVSFSALASTLFILGSYLNLKKRLLPDFTVKKSLFSIRKILKIAKSGLWILLSNISNLLLNGLDLLIANLMVSQTSMGRLSISQQIPNAIGTMLGYMSNIFSASFTELVAHDDKKGLVKEIRFTCKILGIFFTVPFAGIIVFGMDFFRLWLPDNIYLDKDLFQIYVLMLLTLANVIANAYMYSIHSLFIAIDKVKMYSIMIFLSGCISTVLTLVITRWTNLGIYAIAGTSTIILALVNLFIVPLYAEHSIGVKYFTLLRTIFKNYGALLIVLFIFGVIKSYLLVNSWGMFIINMSIIAVPTYLLTFTILLNSEEKHIFIIKVREKIQKRKAEK
ncbi:MATE family efflux transporter [Clostridiaceae bacterium Marseille-Q4145]|nr:MATE family efflux transporter [Clostridiaceae bacterium Marseille-Q4145]